MTTTEALAALSYAEAAKLLADELEYKYQRGIDPHFGEWREAVTFLRRLSAVEAEEASVLAVWRGRVQRLEAERDALRAALNLMTDAFLDTEGNHGPEQQEAMSAAFAAMKGTQE